MLCLPYYCLYSLFNEIKIRAKQFLSGSEGVGGEREETGEKRERMGVGWRNGPNIVCTYE
jgi:hypothetical protein